MLPVTIGTVKRQNKQCVLLTNEEMVLYEVFTDSTKCVYKTSICSKATIVILFINLLTFCVPFLLAYKTQGLWLKHDRFLEQPDVHFKYKYLIILETEKIDKPVICTSFASLSDVSEPFNECQIIKVREEDVNKDNLIDKLIFQAEANVDPFVNVLGLTLLLIFDYKLYSHSIVQMETAGWLESFSPLGGAKFDAIVDLRLKQRQPIRHKGRDLRYNTSLLFDEELSLFSFLKNYAERNLTTRFENEYTTWTRGRAPEQPFKMSISVNIPEETVVYTPGFWQTIKMAWIQYLGLLYISILISRRVKHFILDNRLVHNIKIPPWKKYL